MASDKHKTSGFEKSLKGDAGDLGFANPAAEEELERVRKNRREGGRVHWSGLLTQKQLIEELTQFLGGARGAKKKARILASDKAFQDTNVEIACPCGEYDTEDSTKIIKHGQELIIRSAVGNTRIIKNDQNEVVYIGKDDRDSQRIRDSQAIEWARQARELGLVLTLRGTNNPKKQKAIEEENAILIKAALEAGMTEGFNEWGERIDLKTRKAIEPSSEQEAGSPSEPESKRGVFDVLLKRSPSQGYTLGRHTVVQALGIGMGCALGGIVAGPAIAPVLGVSGAAALAVGVGAAAAGGALLLKAASVVESFADQSGGKNKNWRDRIRTGAVEGLKAVGWATAVGLPTIAAVGVTATVGPAVGLGAIGIYGATLLAGTGTALGAMKVADRILPPSSQAGAADGARRAEWGPKDMSSKGKKWWRRGLAFSASMLTMQIMFGGAAGIKEMQQDLEDAKDPGAKVTDTVRADANADGMDAFRVNIPEASKCTFDILTDEVPDWEALNEALDCWDAEQAAADTAPDPEPENKPEPVKEKFTENAAPKPAADKAPEVVKAGPQDIKHLNAMNDLVRSGDIDGLQAYLTGMDKGTMAKMTLEDTLANEVAQTAVENYDALGHEEVARTLDMMADHGADLDDPELLRDLMAYPSLDSMTTIADWAVENDKPVPGQALFVIAALDSDALLKTFADMDQKGLDIDLQNALEGGLRANNMDSITHTVQSFAEHQQPITASMLSGIFGDRVAESERLDGMTREAMDHFAGEVSKYDFLTSDEVEVGLDELQSRLGALLDRQAEIDSAQDHAEAALGDTVPETMSADGGNAPQEASKDVGGDDDKPKKRQSWAEKRGLRR